MFPVEPISGKMLDYYVGRKDSFLIDLRNPKEYHTGHIKGAVNVPYEEFEEILSNNPDNQITPLSSDLINRHSIAIQKNGNCLIIAGTTYGSSEVSKCGFTKVSIQRRSNSSASWSNYQTYSDLYNNSHQYILSKSISVPSGYQYRVTCTHYAKKNLVSTQKINGTSNILTF